MIKFKNTEEAKAWDCSVAAMVGSIVDRWIDFKVPDTVLLKVMDNADRLLENRRVRMPLPVNYAVHDANERKAWQEQIARAREEGSRQDALDKTVVD